MYFVAHQATDWLVQGKEVYAWDLIHGNAQDLDILDDGSPPELGSVSL